MKGLEALQDLYARLSVKSDISELDIPLEDYYTIEKELKALEIIKNKELNIYFVKRMSLEDFNFCCQYQQQLTQEEYDLLKEVLL